VLKRGEAGAGIWRAGEVLNGVGCRRVCPKHSSLHASNLQLQ
jgi:hypothetical protein